MTTVAVAKKTPGMSPMLMPSYSYDYPKLRKTKLAAVKDGLYHPNLPSFRRMDMDDNRFMLADQHCRTTTTCGPDDFKNAKSTLFDPPKNRLACANITEIGRHLHHYYTTPDELKKSHEAWSKFLDRAPERFQIKLPEIELSKDMHFNGYAIRHLKPDVTHSWRYSLRQEPMLDQYGQRPIPATVFARHRCTHPQFSRKIASETWR